MKMLKIFFFFLKAYLNFICKEHPIKLIAHIPDLKLDLTN